MDWYDGPGRSSVSGKGVWRIGLRVGRTWPRGTEPICLSAGFRLTDQKIQVQIGHLRRSCCRKRGTAVAIPRASMGWDVLPTRNADAVMLLGSIVRGTVVGEIEIAKGV